MNYIEQTYQRAEDLIGDVLIGEKSLLLKDFIFRGEDSAKYTLLPSALREGHLLHPICEVNNPEFPLFNFMRIRKEYESLKKFYAICNRRGIHLPRIEQFEKETHYYFPDGVGCNSSDIWIPEDLLEIAALPQHYGLPTRLLDWSHDFFTALYFASIGAVKRIHESTSKSRFDTEDHIVVWALIRIIIFLKKILMYI